MRGGSSLGGDHPRHRLAQPEARDHLGYITGERSDPRCLLGIGRFATQHEAVIFDRRAAPRRVDYDGIEPGSQALALPRVYVGASQSERLPFLAEVMGERSATTRASGDNAFATLAG